MRVAKAVVVVEGDGAEAIPIFDEQFDGRRILLCVTFGSALLRITYGIALLRIADGTLEAIEVKSGSVDGNDLRTDGHSLLERRPIP